MKLKFLFQAWWYRKQWRKMKLMWTVIQDEDWDYSYIYKLLERKLRNIQEYAKIDTVTYESNWQPRYLDIAIKLCEKLQYGIHDIGYVNINNAKRFRDARDLNFEPRQPNPHIRSEILKQAWEQVDFVKYAKEDLYEIKARHLLFKILENYIGYWWD